MPRRPDMPCSSCGNLMWRGRGSRTDGTAICRSCRSSRVEHGRVSTYKLRKCRCDSCREAWNAQCRRNQSAARARAGKSLRACVSCGTDFQPRSNQVLCSPECRKSAHGRYGDHASRATYWGVEHEAIDRLGIFDRDGWTCGICHLPVARGLTFPDPGYPTLDHIVPMSQGGGHIRSNVQLAHFYCNTVKGNRMEEAC